VDELSPRDHGGGLLFGAPCIVYTLYTAALWWHVSAYHLEFTATAMLWYDMMRCMRITKRILAAAAYGKRNLHLSIFFRYPK